MTTSVIGPVSTIDLIKPFEKGIIGCNRKCPCRTWINCGYYNDTKYIGQMRDNEEYWTEIWEYFNNTFKLTFEMSITNMNG